MLKKFIKEYTSQIVLFAAIILVTGFMFFLFELPTRVFVLLSGLILMIIVIYLMKEVIYFNERRNLTQEIDTLQTELTELKETTQQQQSDLEEYFLMWVHQMKTPITASQLILNNPGHASTTALRQEMLQIENYTNMALNYLKLINPETDMVITKRTLHELLAPLLRKYRIQFIHHDITLHYDAMEAVIVTEANLTSLMIEQLLNNALKYAKNKDIWLKFDEENYQLIIEDNGIGIRPEDSPKIFDKGYSGFNGQLNQKSSGLGLFIVNLIAKRLEQPVTVDSTADEGTKFTIQLHREPEKNKD